MASFYCIYQQANIAFCFQTGYNNLIRHKNDRPAAFAANLPLFFGVYIVGSLVFNGGCVLLMKPARYLAAQSIKNDVKADA